MAYLKYDEATGQIIDKTGVLIYTYVGAVPVDAKTKDNTIVELVKLGLSADDIVKLKNFELL